MTKRTRFRQQFQSLSLAFLLLNLISTIWAPIPVEEENSRLPPNIYKWIEENAHICTIVPSNGEELFNFLSVDEGLKCVLCPEHKPREVPSMACAVEVSPNDVDVEIGCHPIPELCVLELKNRYAEFYMGSPPGPEGPPGGPPGPPGSPPSGSNPPGQNGKRSEEEIFQATANVFSENPVINELAVTEINVDEEEEEEEEQIAMGTQKREEEEVKEVLDILHGRGDTTSTTSTTTISPTMEAVPLTTVQASVFSMPSGPLGVPINLTVSETSIQSRTAAPILGPHGPPGSEGGGEEFSSLEAGGIAIKEPMNMQKRVDGAEELELRGQKSSESCRDVHELCCFWALAGECDGNPFWMRVKCPMTCGTCGCRVKHADKCKSIGVKCVLPTSTTTTTMASSSPSSSSSSTASSLASSPEKSTPAGSTQPTPPPGQRRRTRPTPPARMPGHRPQRPKHQRTSPAGTSTSPQPMVAIKEELPLVKGDWNWKNAVEKGGNVPPGPPTSSYDEDQTEGGPSPPSSTAPPPPLFVVLSLSSAGYADEVEKEGEKEAEGGGENGDDAFEQQQTVPVEPAQPITSESTSTEPAATTSRESCFNYHKLCDFWAKMGECSSNPFWMRPHCQRACLSCGETLGDISTPQPRPGGSLGSHFLPAESSPIPLTGCANEHILCPFWAFIGECGRNPRWMSLHCVASCQLC